MNSNALCRALSDDYERDKLRWRKTRQPHWSSRCLRSPGCFGLLRAASEEGHISRFNVVGTVPDGNGRPVQSGQVCGKDPRAHFLRIKPVDRYGHFSLAGLDARLDDEMDAEQNDLVSNKMLISGSQKSPEVMIELKLNTEQGNQ